MKKGGKITELMLILMIPLVVFVGMFLMNGDPKSSKGLTGKPGLLSPTSGREKPRNDAPMGENTKYFEKNHLDIKDDQGKRELTYYWREPPVTPGMKSYPLVLILHGSPGNAYAASYLAQKAEKYPAFILAPVIPLGTTWATAKPVKNRYQERLGDIVTLIGQLQKLRPIDPTRIYVIGCSEGGYGAFGAARYYSDIFAASVAISSGWPVEEAQYFNKIPLLVMHGALDQNVKVEYSRDISNMSKKYGGKIAYVEFPDMGHECPSQRLYTDTTWDWLFSYHK